MHLVIGDVHGCYKALERLLRKVKFNATHDKVYFCGDLINRGPKSADVLRLVMDLGDCAHVILGNHDLQFLAVSEDVVDPRKKDNSHKILTQPDANELVSWLSAKPLAIFNSNYDFLLVHASVHKSWTTTDCLTYAMEVQTLINGQERRKFFEKMYGVYPNEWDVSLKKWPRARLITNILTRARFCDANGSLNFDEKGPLNSQSKGLFPWFTLSNRKTKEQRIIFGHWSALGLHCGYNTICLDSGYLWGGSLSALKFDDNEREIIQIENN